MVSYTAEESQLAKVLNVIALVALALMLITLLGIFFSPPPTFFNPPFVTASAAGLGFISLLAWFAAADVRRFRLLIYLLITTFVLGAIVFAALLFSVSGQGRVIELAVGIVFSGASALAVGWVLRRAKMAAAPWLPWIPDKSLTTWERIGRGLLTLVGFAMVIAGGSHMLFAFSSPTNASETFRQPLLVGGSAVAFISLGLCALLAAWNIRRASHFLTLLVIGSGIALLAALVTLGGIARFGDSPLNWLGSPLTNQQLMANAALITFIAVIVLLFLKTRIDRSVLDHLGFFTPTQFRALEAIAETLVEGGDFEVVRPYEIVLTTDRYLSSFPSNRLWLARLAVLGLEFMPLLTLRPPLGFLTPATRREFINRHFKVEIVNRGALYRLLDRPILRYVIDLIEGAMRFNMQLAYLGYYSEPSVQKDIGYVPFSQRPEGQKVKPIRKYPPLKVTTPNDLRRDGIDTISSADVVIIGSGASGSILAEQFLQNGREVLILEKGPYVHPDNFNEDEVDMISQLYSDGALQISQSLRFTVLQGSCVGGTTVVNNAVCFDTPDEVLAVWNDPNGANAGIEVDRFKKSQQAIRKRLQIQSIEKSAKTRDWENVLNPGDVVLPTGIEKFLKPGTYGPYQYGVVEANITDCLGCGYCNIGCKYGRKLSMLDEVLPKIQQEHPDGLRIISEAQVTKLNGKGGKITEIVVKLRDKRELVIRNPKTVVVSAGTIASSWLLMRSGIGKGELPVGKRLCFNMGSPLHAYFEQPLNSYAGLQISHYLSLKDRPGFVYETWFNPPVAQALAMPGWLDTHFANMRRYSHMMAVGVLVGTEASVENHLSSALFLRGSPDINYTPSTQDLNKLIEALTILGGIMLEAGATEVLASTRRYQSYKANGNGQNKGYAAFTTSTELADNLRKLVQDERDILLGTGHPQGGNPISKTRGQNGRTGGVIGPDFKVYGYDNLYVCDASVFPGATTVNPQLTVMTLAHYAASPILDGNS